MIYNKNQSDGILRRIQDLQGAINKLTQWNQKL